MSRPYQGGASGANWRFILSRRITVPGRSHPDNFGGPSRKGAWLLTMDGSVKFYNKDTSPALFKALAHPRDGRGPGRAA